MIKKIIVIMLAFVALTLNAQESTSSPYSLFGIGAQKFKGTVENRSMGGIGVYADSVHLNLQNPASFGELKLTTYSVGTSFSSTTIKNQNESASVDDASLDYLAIGIPAGKFGFGFGVIPLTSVGYQLSSVDADESEQQFSGTGGLNKVFLSAGVKVNKNLSVGLDFNYNFGNIENKAILIRPDVQFDTREITSSNLSSFSLSLGLMYRTMVSDKLELQASVVSTPSFGLTSDSSIELSTIVLGNSGQEIVIDRQETDLEERDIDLPAEVKVGGGIGEPKKWFVGGEYTYLDSGDYANALFVGDNVEYKAASKFKLGGFYIPKYNSLTSYFSRVVYRAGFRYEETGLNINETSIDEFGISFGVGLPVGRLFSNANVGFEYGQRGTKDFGLVREDFFNISVSLSLNDKWFRKIKFN